MASIAAKLFAYDAQRAALGRKLGECSYDLDEDSTMAQILDKLYRVAFGYGTSIGMSVGYPSLIQSQRRLIATAVNEIYGSSLNRNTCSIADITAEVRQLVVEDPAYAVMVPSTAVNGKSELRFFRSATAPAVGDTYMNKTITNVFSGFENTPYTSNSAVPWYTQRTAIASVHFDDEIKPLSCAYWFYWQQNCTSYDLTLLNTSECTSFAYMFYSDTSLQSLNLSSLVTSKVNNIQYMFYNCTALTSITFGAWDMSELRNCSQAFRNLTQITVLDLSRWTMPEWTNTMQYMFYNCSKLVTIYVPPGTDLTDTSVGSYCFSSCTKLKGGNGTAYNSSNVTAAMARVDGLNNAAGYFTAKTN